MCLSGHPNISHYISMNIRSFGNYLCSLRRAEASWRNAYVDNVALDKENEPDIVSRIGSRRNRPFDRDWREKLYCDDITAGVLNGGRRKDGSWRLPELGYRNPNIVADKIRVERLLSGYR